MSEPVGKENIMVTEHSRGLPGYSDSIPEEILAQYDQYIVTFVRQRALRSASFAGPSQFDLEVDEMVQQVCIKFWQALSEKHIEHPKAYLRAIVWNKFHELSHKRRQPLPLFANDDGGERYLNDMEKLGEMWGIDYVDDFEESDSLVELMDSTVSTLTKLVPRQRQAMICDLNGKKDASLLIGRETGGEFPNESAATGGGVVYRHTNPCRNDFPAAAPFIAILSC